MSIYKSAQGLTRNPLGIIGLFIVLVYGIAGLVLGASASSLSELQRLILVIFLALFPLVILGVFFRLVTHHHTKLYSPGDYPTDDGFFKALSPEERERKIEKEITSILEEEPKTEIQDDANLDKESLTNKVVIAEDLVFRKLENELGVRIQRYVGNRDIGIDGLFHLKGNEVALEIKYTQKGNWPLMCHTIDKQISRLSDIHSALPWQFLVVLVSSGISANELEAGKDYIYKKFYGREIKVKVKGYRVEDLKQQYGVEFA